MPPNGYFIDSNLLVLLVIGSVDRSLVGLRKRVKEFTPDDYDRVVRIADRGTIYVTPHTLTEASNLVKDEKDTRFQERLRDLFELAGEEVAVPSQGVVGDSAFPRLGLTDVVLLDAISPRRPLLTTDAALYATASQRDPEAAHNFRHGQEFF